MNKVQELDRLAGIKSLFEGTRIVMDAFEITFDQRSASMLVIGFWGTDENSDWLEKLCKTADFSVINIRLKAGGFDNPDIAAYLRALGRNDVIASFERIAVCGTGPAGTAALIHSAHLNRPVVLAFNPSAPASGLDLSQTLTKTLQSTIFYDPFSVSPTAWIKNLAGHNTHVLKCIGMQDACLKTLFRMKILDTILLAALRNELAPGFFYRLIRRRKDYGLYREGMETAIRQTANRPRLARFRSAFRARRDAMAALDPLSALKLQSAQARPKRPGAWVRSKQSDAIWPSVPGNVWMLETQAGRLRYMSDRWCHTLMGYEERAGITLAQTSDLALGFVGFGHGVQVERAPKRRFKWHVTDENLDGTGPMFGPCSEATLYCEALYSAGTALPSILAISQAQAGMTAAEARRDGGPYRALLDRVASAVVAAKDWDKSLFVDRMRLCLLSGAPRTGETDAAAHLATTAQALSRDIMVRTSQAVPPITVLTQSAGCTDVALAEGRFDVDNPTLNAVVASPTYPWPVMDDTQATPSKEAALMLDELCVLAVQERQAGRPWHCPLLQLATIQNNTITAQFSTMQGLHLEDAAAHGFGLDGDGTLPQITSVNVVSDTEIELALSDPIKEMAFLTYAFGTAAQPNHGTLRDQWQADSTAIAGQTLHRYALCARVQVWPR